MRKIVDLEERAVEFLVPPTQPLRALRRTDLVNTNARVADSPDCLVSMRQVNIVATLDRCQCPRAEAFAMSKLAGTSFFTESGHSADVSSGDIAKSIDAAVEKAVVRILAPILNILSSTVS